MNLFIIKTLIYFNIKIKKKLKLMYHIKILKVQQ